MVILSGTSQLHKIAIKLDDCQFKATVCGTAIRRIRRQYMRQVT